MHSKVFLGSSTRCFGKTIVVPPPPPVSVMKPSPQVEVGVSLYVVELVKDHVKMISAKRDFNPRNWDRVAVDRMNRALSVDVCKNSRFFQAVLFDECNVEKFNFQGLHNKGALSSRLWSQEHRF